MNYRMGKVLNGVVSLLCVLVLGVSAPMTAYAEAQPGGDVIAGFGAEEDTGSGAEENTDFEAETNTPGTESLPAQPEAPSETAPAPDEGSPAAPSVQTQPEQADPLMQADSSDAGEAAVQDGIVPEDSGTDETAAPGVTEGLSTETAGQDAADAAPQTFSAPIMKEVLQEDGTAVSTQIGTAEVSFDGHADIPDDTALSVKAVSDSTAAEKDTYQAYYARTLTAMLEAGENTAGQADFLVFSFTSGGQEVLPEGGAATGAEIRIAYDQPRPAEDDETARVIALCDDGPFLMDGVDIEKTAGTENGSGKSSITALRFHTSRLDYDALGLFLSADRTADDGSYMLVRQGSDGQYYAMASDGTAVPVTYDPVSNTAEPEKQAEEDKAAPSLVWHKKGDMLSSDQGTYLTVNAAAVGNAAVSSDSSAASGTVVTRPDDSHQSAVYTYSISGDHMDRRTVYDALVLSDDLSEFTAAAINQQPVSRTILAGVADAQTGESSTEASTEPQTETKSLPQSMELAGESSDGDIHVTVSYDPSAVTNIPENAEVTVRSYSEDDSEYASARQAVLAAMQKEDKTVDADRLGLKALDISIMDGDREIEPDGPVTVRIQLDSLPDDIEDGTGLEIRHIRSTSSGSESSASPIRRILRAVRPAAGVAQETAEVVAENVAVENGAAETEFRVDSFSTFTITWTTTIGNTTSNIGSVSMHYVDVNGLEIDRTATLDPSDLSKISGEVVKISEWVNNADNGIRKVSGYVYQKATLGRNGTEITGLKVDSVPTGEGADAKTNHKLYYTTVADPSTAQSTDWIQYTDSVSGNDSNNADIYLYFKSTTQRVNVHYVDEEGKILINPQYKYADRVYTSNGENGLNINNTDTTSNTWAEQIQGYEFTGRVHMGETGWEGYAFSTVRGIAEGSDNPTTGTHTTYRYQYKLKVEDTNWTDLTATDVYMIYRKANCKKPLTIHYMDLSGNAVKDEAGNELTKTVDAADWTSGTWIDLSTFAMSIDGYTFPSGTLNGSGQDDSKTVIGTTAADDTLSLTPISTSDGDVSLTDNFLGSVKGNFFRFINYTYTEGQEGKGTFRVGRGSINNGTISATRIWSVSGNFDIYLTYKKNDTAKSHTYTVHYVDEDGNEISLPSGQKNPEDAVTINSTHNLIAVTNINKTISGYEKLSTGYLGRATAESGGIPFTSISFTQSDGAWKYQVTNGSTSDATARQLNLKNLNIYVVYRQSTNLRVYYVDENGEKLDASTIRSWNNNTSLDNPNVVSATTGLSGIYTLGYMASQFKEARIGSFDNPEVTVTAFPQIHYSTDNSGNVTSELWINTNGTSGSKYEKYATQPNNLITDVYLVYKKPPRNLTIHCVYTGTDNTLSKIDGVSDGTNVAPGTKTAPTSLSSETYAKTISGKVHIGTRIGPSWKTGLTGADLGPNVTQVYAENGQLYYSFNNETAPYSLTRQGSNNIWVYATPSGRRFTLTRESSISNSTTTESYTIGDSQHGTFTLNQSDDDTWIATFSGEAETTEYTVKKSTSAETTPETGKITTVDTYTLTLRDYIPNNLTDVYEMYIDDSSEAKVWIDDDLKYSGYFMVGRNNWLETRMAGNYESADKITSYYYTWDKITNGTNTTTVERQQNGIHYNVAYNRVDRTWLDVEADNGGRNTTDQKTVSYRVTMHYKQGDSDWKEVSSEPVDVDYYSQLMNGSFETPSKIKDASRLNEKSDFSNETYKELGGVWQTTGSDNEIEIVDTSQKSSFNSYSFNSQADFTTVDTDEGNTQFAELNAEAAGALYQDVITHPNQHLNYWLSHRARGQHPQPGWTTSGNRKDSPNYTPEYDTMYLVIMPTKLAMTGSSSGGELKDQVDLEAFIRKHGGYDNNRATSVGQEVTYRDEDNGVLILKINSNDQFWHTVNVPNGYIAKSGLTRFFFVAGPIAWENDKPPKTHGNFIDAVGFSQQLPKPTGFNLVVSKTFRGLSTDQILGLVGQKGDKENYQIKITDKHADESTHKNSEDGAEDNDALNGAVLSFEENVGGSGGKRYKLTAQDKNGNNLLTGSNTGEAIVNDDGSVTMTWTFVNQALSSNAGQSHSEYFNYYADESNTQVTGFTLTATKEVTNQSSSGTAQTSGEENAALITEGYSGTFTLENRYKDQSKSDQPRIVVSKKFYGLTPKGVEELFSNGYQLTVTNNQNESETLNTNTQEMSSNVTVSGPVEDANNHNTTYTWNITGEHWGAGTYTLKEENYNTDEYKVTQIKINGTEIQTSEEGHNTAPANNASKSGITVGTTCAAQLTYENEVTGLDRGSLTSGTAGEGTNLIIGQYSRGGTTEYVVWTPEPIGANVAQAIVNKINNTKTTNNDRLGWGTTEKDKAEISKNINFRSSTDGGVISSSIGSFSYDPVSRSMTFTASGQNYSWTRFYSAKVSGLDSPDITVENRYNPVVRVLKVDASSHTKALSGAVFNLYKVESNSNKYYMESTSTPTTYSWDAANASDKKKAEYTTDSSGYVLLPDMEPGTYYLEETTAPNGYNKNVKPIAFTVSSSYSVVQTMLSNGKTTDGIEADNPKPDWKQPYYTVTVTNEKGGPMLPNTGGPGTRRYLLTGLVFLMFASWLLWRRKCTRDLFDSPAGRNQKR